MLDELWSLRGRHEGSRGREVRSGWGNDRGVGEFPLDQEDHALPHLRNIGLSSYSAGR